MRWAFRSAPLAALALLCCQPVDDWVAHSVFDGGRPMVTVPVEPSCPDDRGLQQAQSALATARMELADASVVDGLALCVCEDAVIGAGFESGSGGAVFVDGAWDQGADVSVRGSMAVASAEGIDISPDQWLHVGGNLVCGGNLHGPGSEVRVAGDSALAGDVTLQAWSVAGGVALSEAASVSVVGGAPEAVRGTVTVSASCNCTTPWAESIASMFSAAPPALGPSAVPSEVAVCGTATLQPQNHQGNLRVTGNGLLVVRGDLSVPADLLLVPDGQGELVVVVTGNLTVAGRIDAGRPGARATLIVGGNGNLRLGAGAEIYGDLYMPEAELVVASPVKVRGTVVTQRMLVSAPLALQTP